MTWNAATTPDEVAQQGDSLVASILRSSHPSPNDLQIGRSEPTTEESSVVVPQWMRWHLDQIALRQRLRMNLH